MRTHLITLLVPLLVFAARPATAQSAALVAPKVMIVAMYGPEGQVWLDRMGPWRKVPVAGLAPDHPDVACNPDDVCVVTIGMGHANAAASTMALVLSPAFDLSRTYFLIAGIAGINAERGTIGSVAWARYLVDFGIQWEIDSREIPKGWNGGYLAINGRSPSDKPQFEYRTEVFEMNAALLEKALALSRGVELADAAIPRAVRAKYRRPPANMPPAVLQCDTVTGDTWTSGKRLGERADEWMRIVTDGRGSYCTTQQEDNATYEALKRGAALGRVDADRVAVLRGASDFDRPHEGQSAADNLVNYQAQGAFGIALQNLYRAGHPLVESIVTRWPEWRNGVPAD